MACQRASRVRAPILRRMALILAKAFSIGLRSGRQVEQRRPTGLDRLADADDLVGGDVVHHDDVAGPEGGRQNLLDVVAEDDAGQRAVEDVGGRDAVQAEPGDQGRGFPVAVGHRVDQALAPRAAAVGARQRRGRRRLVEEDQALGIERRLPDDGAVARLGDVRPPLLGGVQAFF